MKKTPYSNRLIGNKFSEKRIQKAIRRFLISRFIACTHATAVRWLMQAIFDALQEAYREDNTATTAHFMIEEVIRASDMSPSSLMYKDFMDVTDDKLCPKCKGDRLCDCGAPCPKCKGSGLK